MLRPTLTRHLLMWALGALLIVWLSFIAFGYKTGQHEADELTDGHLASTSALLLAYSGGQFAEGGSQQAASQLGELRAHDYQQSMSVVVWDATGRVLTRTGSAPLPPFSPDEGFATLQLGQPQQQWRSFARWDGGHDRKLMVLLSIRERDELADDIAEQVSEPGLWLLPVVALLLGVAIRRGLRPLHDVTRDVHALDIHQGQPLAVRPRHDELAATVDAINRLVERYHAALSRERALASEFAHELRTPLAALALHARTLRDAPGDREAAERIEREVQRAGEVLAHLLALARASRAELDEAAQAVDLTAVARDLVARFAPAAQAGGRELGLAATEAPLQVTGHAVLLEVALRNLIENALHHTPRGTEVEVAVDAPGRWVEVRDVPPAQSAAAAGDSPATALGLGLGHRVVDKIAAIHGARFERRAGDQGGAAYRITFG